MKRLPSDRYMTGWVGVYAVLMFVICAWRCVCGEYILYCTRLYSVPWIKYNRSGKERYFSSLRGLMRTRQRERSHCLWIATRQSHSFTQAITLQNRGEGQRMLVTHKHTFLPQWGGCFINYLEVQFPLKNDEIISSNICFEQHIIYLLYQLLCGLTELKECDS